MKEVFDKILEALPFVLDGVIKKFEVDGATVYKVKDIVRIDIKCEKEGNTNG